jgi:uncharacterized protein
LIVYFESSALLKLFLNEPDADLALQVWNEADGAVTSEISHLEVHAGLARAVRENPPKLSNDDYENAKDRFDQLWLELTSIAVSTELIQKASGVASEYALRAYDALHFATVLDISDDEILLATTNQELERAAKAADIPLTQLSHA